MSATGTLSRRKENMIRSCIDRLQDRREAALRAATFQCGHQRLPRPDVRKQLRVWFDARLTYLEIELAKERT